MEGRGWEERGGEGVFTFDRWKRSGESSSLTSVIPERMDQERRGRERKEGSQRGRTRRSGDGEEEKGTRDEEED